MTPSPAIATTRPSRRRSLDDRALVLGQNFGLDFVDAELARHGLRRGALSPVSMTTRMPSAVQRRERVGRRRLDRIGDAR